SQKLADEFNEQFKAKFGRDASFCCTFSDYERMFNFIPGAMKTKKYKVSYKPNAILSFKKNNRVARSYAKQASDSFLEDFLKFADKKKFPDADKKVVLIEEKPKAKAKTKTKASKPTKDLNQEEKPEAKDNK